MFCLMTLSFADV